MRRYEHMFQLGGKVAIVTGGGRGIGRELCIGLSQFGAGIMVCDIDSTNCQKTADEIRKDGREAEAFVMDVTSAEQISAMVLEVKKKFGKIDILINNAGIQAICPAEEFSLDDWNRVLKVNITGVFLCSQICGREMIRQKGGAIINIASVAGQVGTSLHNAIAYNTSKGGVVNFTRSLAVEWAKYNISVNAIAPGMMETDLTRERLSQPEYRKRVLELVPAKKIGTPEDLVGAAVFLASDAARMITGHILNVEGGMLAI